MLLTEAVTLKLSALEAPPPGVGLKTVIVAGPSVIRSLAGICAVSWVLLTKFVVRLAPFHRTVAPLTKPAPVTVSVNAEPPPLAEAGFKPLSVGSGFSPDCVTVKVCAPMVSVPVRAFWLVLAATEKLPAPLPAPLLPEVMVMKLALLVAVQVQPPCAVTATLLGHL